MPIRCSARRRQWSVSAPDLPLLDVSSRVHARRARTTADARAARNGLATETKSASTLARRTGHESALDGEHRDQPLLNPTEHFVRGARRPLVPADRGDHCRVPYGGPRAYAPLAAPVNVGVRRCVFTTGCAAAVQRRVAGEPRSDPPRNAPTERRSTTVDNPCLVVVVCTERVTARQQRCRPVWNPTTPHRDLTFDPRPYRQDVSGHDESIVLRRGLDASEAGGV